MLLLHELDAFEEELTVFEVECGEDRIVVAQLVQLNFAGEGVEKEIKNAPCSFYVCSGRIATPARRATPP